MRSLFIVISKVWGLMQALAGVTYILMLFPMISLLGRNKELVDAEASLATTFHGEHITLSVISLSAMVLVTFAFAWLLIFRADWLADKLKIPDAGAQTPPSVKVLLYAGVKLIGVFLVVQGIPLLAQTLSGLRYGRMIDGYIWSVMTLPALRLVLGLGLVIKTQWVVKFVLREASQNNTSDGAA